MRSRVLSSAILPAIAFPALAIGPANHNPAVPGFGISRAVHFVTSTIGSVTSGLPFGHHSGRPTVGMAGRPRRFVVIDCAGRGEVRPRGFQLACADGNDYLSRLRWQTWWRGYATATGTQTINDCQPTCAGGRFHSYPVRVILWGGAPVPGHHAEERYTMITLLYTGGQPPVSGGSMPGPPSVTGTLWS